MVRSRYMSLFAKCAGSRAGTLRRLRRLAPVIALVLVAGCGGGEDEPAATPSPAPAGGGGAPYVGSLSVDPERGTLMIGTGLGLFRLEPGSAQATPVEGELTTPDGTGTIAPNLVLRYTGPGQLLASGHPKDGGSGLPENLGLIRSDDDGATWTPVSLLGEEDFHALDVRGDVVAGQPVEAARVLVSDDGGKTFAQRTPPAVPIDLDLDPSDPRRVALTTADGVFVSTDGGGSWRQRDVATGESHLAWAEQGPLYRVDAAGAVQVSDDGGERWQPAGNVGGMPTTVTVDAEGRLYAALAGGSIVRSDDGGQTFTELTSLAR